MQTSSKVSLGPVDNSASLHSALKTVPYNSVRINNGFWANRQTNNRQVSLKYGYEMLEKAGNFKNLRIAAGWEKGSYSGRNFHDENIYKWLEALAWELGNEPDDDLQQMADEVITLISAAQQPDGYLNSYYQIVEPDNKWADLDFSHELYCAGHLFQAAVAFQRALGDERLMIVSRRLADHINSVFGPGKKEAACGHPEIEMALVELYRSTREAIYLNLAKFFIDQRGQRKMIGLGSYGPEYHQDHLPVRQAVKATGHAVRQMYLSTAIADLYMETGEQALYNAANQLWSDIEESKLYITGGVGSRYDGESIGESYELPPDQCYCETCAAIGSLFFNWRLLLITGDSRFADLIERTLYNGILSSPAMDGKHFFYVNPLMVRDARSMRLSTNPGEGAIVDGRPEWHNVACCPPNVMRLFSSLAHYISTYDQSGVQIHLYPAADIHLDFRDGQVKLQIKTDYPWDGLIQLTMIESDDEPWVLRLRVPEWCPSFLVSVNNEVIDVPKIEKGYLVLSREWRSGDLVRLELSMKPELVESNPRVDATRDCLAIQQGPLVYCLETFDNPGLNLLDVRIDEAAPLLNTWEKDLLPEAVMAIKAKGYVLEDGDWQGHLYRPVQRDDTPVFRPVQLKAIPYYAWANRGVNGMRVWIPRTRFCSKSESKGRS